LVTKKNVIVVDSDLAQLSRQLAREANEVVKPLHDVFLRRPMGHLLEYARHKPVNTRDQRVCIELDMLKCASA
jgi:hypothetical protein